MRFAINICRLLLIATVPLYISGLYFNRPNPERKVLSVKDMEQFKMMEQSLLRSLGLSSRPRPRQGVKIPRHMMDLYYRHMEHPDWISTNFRFDGKWTEANTIRSYYHEDDQTDMMSGNKGTAFLNFDISSMPNHENVTTAQLRLYRRNSQKENDSNSTPPINGHRVVIYQVLTPATENRPANLRLLDSRQVYVGSSGWETFDVLSAVRHWAFRPKESYGLEVHTFQENGRKPKNSVFILSKNQDNSNLNEDEWNEVRPLLVSYNHDGQEYRKRRQKRAALVSPTAARSKKDFCRRRPLYVNFADLTWNDWIVAPPGYEAYLCKGVCPFPIDYHLNTTNHAVVQTVVHNINPSAVPGVCCVPTSLKPIRMLYLDANEKTVLKNYPSMVVEGCGCR